MLWNFFSSKTLSKKWFQKQIDDMQNEVSYTSIKKMQNIWTFYAYINESLV